MPKGFVDKITLQGIHISSVVEAHGQLLIKESNGAEHSISATDATQLDKIHNDIVKAMEEKTVWTWSPSSPTK